MLLLLFTCLFWPVYIQTAWHHYKSILLNTQKLLMIGGSPKTISESDNVIFILFFHSSKASNVDDDDEYFLVHLLVARYCMKYDICILPMNRYNPARQTRYNRTN